jgi:hypothetical protein
MRCLDQPPEHQSDHGEAEIGNRKPCSVFVVLGQPAVPSDPTECALDDLPFWQHDEAVQVCSFDDLNLLRPECPDRSGRGRALITPIGEDALDKGEQPAHRLQYQQAAVSVLHVCGMNNHVQHQAERIDEDVTLLAFDLLTCIVANRIETGPLFPRSLRSDCR